MKMKIKLMIILLIIINLIMTIGNISFAVDNASGRSFLTANATSIDVSFGNKTIEKGKDIIIYIKTDKSIKGREITINENGDTRTTKNEVAYINEDGIYCYQYYIFQYQGNTLNDLQINKLPQDNINMYLYIKYNNQIFYVENMTNINTQKKLQESDGSKFIEKSYYTDDEIQKLKQEDTKIMKQKWADGLGININDVDKYIDMYNAKGLGKLHKDGQKLKNSNNEEVQLNGVGLFHLLDYGYMYNSETIGALKYWGVNCIRLPAYVRYRKSISGDTVTSQDRGLDTALDEYLQEMDRIIEAASEQGLYCMVDFHILKENGDLSNWTELSEQFFKHFLEKYGQQDNMIWEIANEPFSTSNENLEAYINDMVKLIKKYDDSPVVICGSNRWSDNVAIMYEYFKDKDCINDIFISSHYYDRADISKYKKLYETTEIPLMFTEWGNAPAAPSSTINSDVLEKYTENTKKYFSWWNENNISNCVWMYCHGDYTYSLWKNLGEKKSQILRYGVISDEYLTYNGKLTLNNYLNAELNKIKKSGVLDKKSEDEPDNNNNTISNTINDNINNNTDNSTKNNTINEVKNITTENKIKNNKISDSTTAKTILPFAGINSKIILLIIIILIALICILYNKNIKYKDIK